MASIAQPGPERDEVRAHRGASAITPESIVATFRAADEQGARWVKLNVALRAPNVRITISSFHSKALEAMHTLERASEIAVLWPDLPNNWEESLAAVPATTIHLSDKALSMGSLEKVRASGIEVRACNDPVDLMSFWGARLTGMITDNSKAYLG